jgi:hypothetical protein
LDVVAQEAMVVLAAAGQHPIVVAVAVDVLRFKPLSQEPSRQHQELEPL